MGIVRPHIQAPVPPLSVNRKFRWSTMPWWRRLIIVLGLPMDLEFAHLVVLGRLSSRVRCRQTLAANTESYGNAMFGLKRFANTHGEVLTFFTDLATNPQHVAEVTV